MRGPEVPVILSQVLPRQHGFIPSELFAEEAKTEKPAERGILNLTPDMDWLSEGSFLALGKAIIEHLTHRTVGRLELLIRLIVIENAEAGVTPVPAIHRPHSKRVHASAHGSLALVGGSAHWFHLELDDYVSMIGFGIVVLAALGAIFDCEIGNDVRNAIPLRSLLVEVETIAHRYIGSDDRCDPVGGVRKVRKDILESVEISWEFACGEDVWNIATRRRSERWFGANKLDEIIEGIAFKVPWIGELLQPTGDFVRGDFLGGGFLSAGIVGVGAVCVHVALFYLQNWKVSKLGENIEDQITCS